MKKAFIFDLFGTLVNVFEKSVYKNLVNEMSEAMTISSEDFYKYWNVETYDDRTTGKYKSIEENIRFILEENHIEISEKQIKDAVKIRLDFAKRGLEMKRDALLETLSDIKNRGYKIGLISDCSPDVPEVWDSLEYSQYFDSAIFSSVVGIKKPNPQIYQKSIDSLKVKFDECYYIGDGGSNELTGAQNVGMHPILIKSEADEQKNVYKKYIDEWKGERIFDLSELMNYK